MNDDKPEDKPEENEGGGRRLDPELKTLGYIIRLLDDVDDAARARMVSYLQSRYTK